MSKIKELLKLISKGLLGIQDKKAPPELQPNEILSRFIFSKNHINAAGPKQGAFLPMFQESQKRFETSVFRKTKSGNEYKNIKRNIAEIRKKEIKATALISVADVEGIDSLSVESDETNHKWHANIIDWPSEKNEQKQLAQMLAIRSRLE